MRVSPYRLSVSRSCVSNGALRSIWDCWCCSMSTLTYSDWLCVAVVTKMRYFVKPVLSFVAPRFEGSSREFLSGIVSSRACDVNVATT
eukprot:scaffold5701_cov155-Skeletonema_dohrnii-CCMP3373.AAC.4